MKYLFFLLLSIGSGAEAMGQKLSRITYHCPPCGNPGCDSLVFDHPGTCPLCHMRLVEDTVKTSGRQSLDPGFAGHWSGTALTTDQQLGFSLDIGTNPLKIFFNSADLKALKVSAGNIQFNGDSLAFSLTGDNEVTTFTAALKNGVLNGKLTANDKSVAKQNQTATFTLERQLQPKLNYTTRDVVFNNGPVTLSGTLYLPDCPGRVPAVVYNHSSGDQQRYDGAFMADYLASRGISVLTYDKRGDGASTGNWKTASFEDLADDCIAGIRYLQTIPALDPKRIGIFGHSQGGTISPIIVSRCDAIAFNIAAAAFAVSPEEQDIFRIRNILKTDAHFNDKVIDSAIRFYKIWLRVAKTGKGWNNLQQADKSARTTQWYRWVQPPEKTSWVWKWYRTAGNYNYVPFWQKVTYLPY